ncbi:hypothetical protein PFLU3_32060 [Pseudomonas fluorescens]|uniref:Uncharacterized protein n=1 Tax=Pseudomonas fluorescens TaxID=294 RepID=A0A0D0TKH1_PSEFL|nr:hypothetical protein C4K02_3764 [Pseudomonas synxantha]KIR21385.1 hypothetical protein PFLU3_32060 [Pseudomonas fluorescens]
MNAALSKMDDHISDFFEHPKVTRWHRVVDQRHPIVELLPLSRNVVLWIVSDLRVNEVSKSFTSKKPEVHQCFVFTIYSCFKCVIF